MATDIPSMSDYGRISKFFTTDTFESQTDVDSKIKTAVSVCHLLQKHSEIIDTQEKEELASLEGRLKSAESLADDSEKRKVIDDAKEVFRKINSHEETLKFKGGKEEPRLRSQIFRTLGERSENIFTNRLNDSTKSLDLTDVTPDVFSKDIRDFIWYAKGEGNWTPSEFYDTESRLPEVTNAILFFKNRYNDERPFEYYKKDIIQDLQRSRYVNPEVLASLTLPPFNSSPVIMDLVTQINFARQLRDDEDSRNKNFTIYGYSSILTSAVITPIMKLTAGVNIANLETKLNDRPKLLNEVVIPVWGFGRIKSDHESWGTWAASFTNSSVTPKAVEDSLLQKFNDQMGQVTKNASTDNLVEIKNLNQNFKNFCEAYYPGKVNFESGYVAYGVPDHIKGFAEVLKINTASALKDAINKKEVLSDDEKMLVDQIFIANPSFKSYFDKLEGIEKTQEKLK